MSSPTHPLDNPAFAALTGPHARFAERRGNALRYPVDVSPFIALPTQASPADWDDLAVLAGPGAIVPLAGETGSPPSGWELVMSGEAVQLVDEGVAAVEDPEAVRLGPADVPEMLALVAAAKPGPFGPRTVELGTYLGIRRGGALVAMAGERLRPPGWTEISAVCTDAAYRGQGLATRLVRTVAAGILARGETPFLHAAADNVNAIRLYLALGFRQRQGLTFAAWRVPGRPGDVPEQSARPAWLPADDDVRTA